jgi:hypothetical protein
MSNVGWDSRRGWSRRTPAQRPEQGNEGHLPGIEYQNDVTIYGVLIFKL